MQQKRYLGSWERVTAEVSSCQKKNSYSVAVFWQLDKVQEDGEKEMNSRIHCIDYAVWRPWAEFEVVCVAPGPFWQLDGPFWQLANRAQKLIWDTCLMWSDVYRPIWEYGPVWSIFDSCRALFDSWTVHFDSWPIESKKISSACIQLDLVPESMSERMDRNGP